MLMNLLLGCATVFVSMGLQVVVVVMTLRYLLKILNSGTRENSGFGFGFDTYIISVVLLMLFVCQLFQFSVWDCLL